MDNKIKTFEDACTQLGIDAQALPDVSLLPTKHRNALLAHYKLVIIAEALNEGWQPNWNDWDEAKYFPYFEVEASEDKPSGFGFSDTDCAYWGASAVVCSRLCFRTAELAKYAGKQFVELYKEYFLFT